MCVDWDWEVSQWKKDLANAEAKRDRNEHLETWEMEAIANEKERIAKAEKRRTRARARM